MAKKSGGPNKSQAIRDYYTANPSAKPMEVAAELGKKGIDVTPAFVSTVKSTTMGKSAKKSARKSAAKSPAAKKTGAKRGRPAGSTSKAASNEVSLDSLLQVKKIVEEMGSVQDAKNALTALEKLMG
ncbi:hypothetical protein LOC71_14445 [Rhodopirellula sp. JC740]|uniref:Uncharacterized protein n=2 Tax=Rhodopirellula halodulae TaxID=2894198 RepID=A0ABS8NLX4_9BACT|nr:hypothetical protein [Rhodopirellula sp. JC740]MCC9643481.1 hypothetical protein [Rhodopirellula sp. JC740]MCC9658127.1 hypothetical protein [Rhodopirellula sp. JC737]